MTSQPATRRPRSFRGPMGLALAELAAPDGPADAGPIEDALALGLADQLSKRVFEHRLDAPFAAALSQLGQPVPEGHAERVGENRLVRMRVAAALARVAALFDANGIEWVAIKGPVVSHWMKHPEHRAHNDLDILVAGGQFGDVLDLLVAEGADELNHNWAAYVQHRVGEVPVWFENVTVDLHWALVGLGKWRDTMRLDVDAMLRRRRSVALGPAGNGPTVTCLDPVDALLHVCLHAGLSGANRLDWLRDIAVLARAPGLDWDDLVRRARGSLVAPLVGHALDRSVLTLGAPIPAGVCEHMGGTSLRLRRWVDARDSGGDGSLRALPVIAARNSALHRWRARRVLATERIRGWASPTYGWDFADPESVLFKDTISGGDEGRAAFIELAR